MRIAEYKKINTRTEQYEVTVPAEYDEEGNITTEQHTETRTREVPVMGMVYRDATPQEEAQAERLAAEMPQPEPTPEQRIAALQTKNESLEQMNNMLTECLLEMSEIVYA